LVALNSALQRARQRRTMAGLRQLRVAVGSYEVDNGSIPRIGQGPAEGLGSVLVPTYTRTLPAVDGWSHSFLFVGEGSRYTLVSTGADGARQNARSPGPTTSCAAASSSPTVSSFSGRKEFRPDDCSSLPHHLR